LIHHAKSIIESGHDEGSWLEHEKEHSSIDFNLAFGLKAS